MLQNHAVTIRVKMGPRVNQNATIIVANVQTVSLVNIANVSICNDDNFLNGGFSLSV